MFPIKSRLYIASSLLLFSGLLLSGIFPASVHSRTKVVYVPPKSLGAPISTRPALVRGKCNEANKAECVKIIMPGNYPPEVKSSLDYYPQTISEHPIFFFSAPKVEGKLGFKLYEESDAVRKMPHNMVFRTATPIATDAPGIISFRLPSNAPVLKVGKYYTWEFFLDEPDVKYKCQGSVVRISLTPAMLSQLKRAQPMERAAIYAKAGIWFETVETLAEARSAQPNDPEIKAEWVELLKSVKLDNISQLSWGNTSKTKYSESHSD